MGGGGALGAPVFGAYKLCALTAFGHTCERLWELWSAVPMDVIIIFLTQFVIWSVNEISDWRCSNSPPWVCLPSTYENAWVCPAVLAMLDSVSVCLFLTLWPGFKKDVRQLEKAHVLDQVSFRITRQGKAVHFISHTSPILAKSSKIARRVDRDYTRVGCFC